MVRVAGQTPTMDNREDLLDALNDFTRKQPKEIPPLLEQYLKQVAKTGETLFPWSLLKGLFVAKLEQVMQQFSEEFGSDQIPPCPNVENARVEVYRQRIMEAVQKFHGAPFTVQRLCELLTDPKRHYKRCDKFMRGLEKNILVVSTVDPYGKKVVSEAKAMVNGMDTNNSASPTSDEASPTTASSSTPPVPVWNTSSPTTIWPLGVDGAATDVTTSSALLEISETPGPSDASPAISSPTSASVIAAPAESASPSNVSSSGALEMVTNNLTSSTPAHAVNGVDSISSEAASIPIVEAGADSSVQQVAAEEMVTGVEVAVPTSQEASVDAMVQESVVETSPAEPLPGEAAVPTDSPHTAVSNTDWLSTIHEKEANAAPCSSPEKGSEVGSSAASPMLTSTVSAQEQEESPTPSSPSCIDSHTEAQAASSSGSVLAETGSDASQTSDAKEACDMQQPQELTVSQGDLTTSGVMDETSWDTSATPSNSVVSSSEDVPAATALTADAPTSSTTTTTTSSEEPTSRDGTSSHVTVDTDSSNSDVSASAGSADDMSASADDRVQSVSESVTYPTDEVMDQD